ncbi:YciI family protein [Salinactinospora qingdaonensis]|uniref:YCII-related domain-containing protein n=1 Tax=Salinactinospora qingdaonensis TaxID=702744 RepID=A0ABP7ERN5_9ACTN
MIDGVFTEAKELIAGCWLLQAASWDEVLEWIKCCPAEGAEIEGRQVFEAEGFGAEFTPELREPGRPRRWPPMNGNVPCCASALPPACAGRVLRDRFPSETRSVHHPKCPVCETVPLTVGAGAFPRSSALPTPIVCSAVPLGSSQPP